jgi:hypothetical protein
MRFAHHRSKILFPGNLLRPAPDAVFVCRDVARLTLDDLFGGNLEEVERAYPPAAIVFNRLSILNI